MDRQCYSRTSLAEWLKHKPQLPHNRAAAAPQDLGAAMATRSPQGSGCSKASVLPFVETQLSKIAHATPAQIAAADRTVLSWLFNFRKATSRVEKQTLIISLFGYLLFGDGIVLFADSHYDSFLNISLMKDLKMYVRRGLLSDDAAEPFRTMFAHIFARNAELRRGLRE